MNAREEIAYHLWTAVPSSDNDKAKARAKEMLDAYRAEILAEVADFFEQQRPTRDQVDTDFQRGRRACVVRKAMHLIDEHPHPGDDPAAFYSGLLATLAPELEEATAAAATATPEAGGDR